MKLETLNQDQILTPNLMSRLYGGEGILLKTMTVTPQKNSVDGDDPDIEEEDCDEQP